MATCDTGATRAMGTVSDATSIACQGTLKNGVCQQVTVSCPGLPDIYAYVKTNTPTGASLGTVTYSTGTNGVSLYDSVFTYGSTAVQNVLNAGYTTVQISWGSPFNTTQVNGWVDGPGGVLESACRIATLNQWIYLSIQNNTSLPYCATGNSGGAGALAVSLVPIQFGEYSLHGRDHQRSADGAPRLGLRLHRRQTGRAVRISPNLGHLLWKLTARSGIPPTIPTVQPTREFVPMRLLAPCRPAA